jgi:hypothetical protein
MPLLSPFFECPRPATFSVIAGKKRRGDDLSDPLEEERGSFTDEQFIQHLKHEIVRLARRERAFRDALKHVIEQANGATCASIRHHLKHTDTEIVHLAEARLDELKNMDFCVGEAKDGNEDNINADVDHPSYDFPQQSELTAQWVRTYRAQ